MLKPLSEANQPVQQTEPEVTCEYCGLSVVMSQARNYIAAIGNPYIKCPYNEHWACSTEHVQFVGHACLNEHIIPLLKIALGEPQ